jgi:hypothetical protein
MVVAQPGSSAPKASAEVAKTSALVSIFDREPDAAPLVDRFVLVFITGGSDVSLQERVQTVPAAGYRPQWTRPKIHEPVRRRLFNSNSN